jgi:predicted RecB family endonuclease
MTMAESTSAPTLEQRIGELERKVTHLQNFLLSPDLKDALTEAFDQALLRNLVRTADRIANEPKGDLGQSL